jgi:hypothetical protein
MKKGLLTEQDIEKVKETKHGSRTYHIKEYGAVPSVTSVLDVGFPKEYGLIQWFINNTAADIQAKREAALTKGTETHKVFEYFAHARFNEKILTPSKREIIRGAIQWSKDMKPEMDQVEAAVCYIDDHIQTAGRVDLVCEIGGERYLVDLKTGHGIYPSYVAQLGLYATALGLNKAAVLLLTNTKKGYRFQEVDVKIGFELFEAAFRIYKYLKEKK